MNYFFSIVLGLFCMLSQAQEIALETFATGFNDPVSIQNAGDDRLFVVEQAGLIQVIGADGTRLATPYLDINPIVNNGGGERGLLGLAFHPDYETNGYFYVNYINNSGNTVISRFTRNASDPNVADSTSELQLLTYVQPYQNHNGGGLAFGPDGYLYIASGDGGSAGDPGDRAQSLTTLLGKLLRIDVDTASNGNNYGIPADNPFADDPSAMPEIWAYGLRNPWKFSFDRTTGDLWIADVGQNVYEEINMVAPSTAGVNYGWRCYEANSAYNQSGVCPDDNALTFPIAQYSHNGDGPFKCSITGGFRYRGTAQPTLTGRYFFADYCSNEIGILQQNGDVWNMTFTTPFSGNNWTTFGEDMDGELYIAGNTSGTVYKIIDPNLGIDETQVFGFELFPNPAGDHFTVTVNRAPMALESIGIYDLQGKLIASTSGRQQQTVTISTKALAQGLYIVKVTSSEGAMAIRKLIKS